MKEKPIKKRRIYTNADMDLATKWFWNEISTGEVCNILKNRNETVNKGNGVYTFLALAYKKSLELEFVGGDRWNHKNE